jgi:hypothetical protein
VPHFYVYLFIFDYVYQISVEQCCTNNSIVQFDALVLDFSFIMQIVLLI